MTQYKTAPMSSKKAGCTCFIVAAYMLEKQILEGNQEQKKQVDNTFDIAGSLFGEGSAEQKAVNDAWHVVGEAKKPDEAELFAGMAKKITKSN